MSQELREAINAIFTEYDKPSTTKTYPGQKSRVRRGAAIDQILALFTTAQIQLVSELEGELPKTYTLQTGLLWDSQDATDGFHECRDKVTAILEHKKQELERLQ